MTPEDATREWWYSRNLAEATGKTSKEVASSLLEFLAQYGLAIVPIEPTEGMTLAGSLAHNADLRPLATCITVGEARTIYGAMLPAAPR